MDLIVGPAKGDTILTIVDRKSDFAIIEKLNGKHAKPLARAVKKRLKYLTRRKQLFSITTDNGTEFAEFKQIERSLKIPVYFAKPYCSCDKPRIEHLNALIRQYILKRSSFKNLTSVEIQHIENKLNHRPRKKLGYKTPFEVFILHDVNVCCT